MPVKSLLINCDINVSFKPRTFNYNNNLIDLTKNQRQSLEPGKLLLTKHKNKVTFYGLSAVALGGEGRFDLYNGVKDYVVID